MSDKKVPAAEIRDRVRAWQELSDKDRSQLTVAVLEAFERTATEDSSGDGE